MNKTFAAMAAVLSGVAVLLATQSQTFVRVDAGGPKLRMIVAGSGSPAVVFDTGGEGSLELWGTVPSEVSKFTKSIAFDRAGNGLSDKATAPRDGRTVATELHTALRNANLSPPYVPVVLIHATNPFPFRSRTIDENLRQEKLRAPARLRFHKEWVEKIPGGRFVTAKAHHGGMNFEVPALVTQIIRETVEKAPKPR